MPKRGHRVVWPTRLEAWAFTLFLYRYNHRDRMTIGTLVALSEESGQECVMGLQTLQRKMLSLLFKRLTRGSGRKRIIRGEPDKLIKLELPLFLLDYAVSFSPAESGRKIIHEPPSNSSALKFLERCRLVYQRRRGRPFVKSLETRLGRIGERQEYRLIRRDIMVSRIEEALKVETNVAREFVELADIGKRVKTD